MTSETDQSLNDELQTAQHHDADDPLSRFRRQFHFPVTDGVEDVYFVGNSLGLQPKRTAAAVDQILAQWKDLGVAGHFRGEAPWIDLPESLNSGMSSIVGALPHEVVLMNTLTVNLHLMLATFYRPQGSRHKILIEDHAFPSDHQAVASHLQLRGFDPNDSMVVIRPADQEWLLNTDHVIDVIRKNRDSLALIMLPGIQYYTGQLLEMRRLTEVAHELEISIGFDLAHAAGNVPLQLHDWDVDFACWCTYKYLNAGPGALGGCFIHERHARDRSLPRMTGWWGHERSSRFLMAPDFVPPPTAMGWQISNPPILAMSGIKASLEVFDEAGGMEPLRQKSLAMTRYFRELLRMHAGGRVHVLTPDDPEQQGCQLSLEIEHEGTSGRATFDGLEDRCIRTDWREPNVIRAAPVPLYNSYEDIWRFVSGLVECLAD